MFYCRIYKVVREINYPSTLGRWGMCLGNPGRNHDATDRKDPVVLPQAGLTEQARAAIGIRQSAVIVLDNLIVSAANHVPRVYAFDNNVSALRAGSSQCNRVAGSVLRNTVSINCRITTKTLGTTINRRQSCSLN